MGYVTPSYECMRQNRQPVSSGWDTMMGHGVWLNGDEVIYDNRYGSFEADMTKTNVTFKLGKTGF